MKFEERIAEFPGRRLLRKHDAHNNPIGDPILVTLERNEGQVYETGTAVTAENLNKGNWRDDDSLSFKMRAGGLPEARPDETQIVTATDGKTWIIPPEGLGCAKEIRDRVGSVVTIGGCKEDISFVSDPQEQIDGKLDKVTTSDADRRVYAIGYNGEQVIYPVENGYGSGPVGYIVARNSNYSINLPVSGRDYIDSDAVPKKYIDDADARKQDKLTAGSGISISGSTISADAEPIVFAISTVPSDWMLLTSGATGPAPYVNIWYYKLPEFIGTYEMAANVENTTPMVFFGYTDATSGRFSSMTDIQLWDGTDVFVYSTSSTQGPMQDVKITLMIGESV